MAHSVSNSAGRLDGGGSFQVNLTAWCNTGCSCSSSLVEPVCGNNGLTYFSPCHAGCSSYSPQHKFSNCTCKLPTHCQRWNCARMFVESGAQ